MLFVTEMAERFSYFSMRAIFVLYLVAALYERSDALHIYASYSGLIFLTPLIGGYIADRYWGERRSIVVGGSLMSIGHLLLFLSAYAVKQSRSGELGMINPMINNDFSVSMVFAGLALLIVGNGFFKPNISTMVGKLYTKDDHRRDSAYTYFYMGINIGAFLAPIISGLFGEGNWSDLTPFKWVFLVSSCVLALATLNFKQAAEDLLISPDDDPIGLPPENTSNTSIKKVFVGSPWYFILNAYLFVILFIVFSLNAYSTSDYIGALVYATAISLPIFILTDSSLSKEERLNIAIICIIAVFVICFWSAYEQAGSSLTLFARDNVDRTIFGMEMPVSWFQSITPFCIILLAPVMAAFWTRLHKFGKEPSPLGKQIIGMALLSVGYYMMSKVTEATNGVIPVSLYWLFGLYFIHTIAELCISPVGLSIVTKLSPARFSSLLMGVWLLSNSASNIIGGQLAALMPSTNKTASTFFGFAITRIDQFFLVFAIISGAAAVVMLLLWPILHKKSDKLV